MFSFRNVVLTALSALAMTVTTSSAFADEQNKELEKRFAEADKDKDGKLTADEAKAMPRVSKNFGRIDKNKQGYVTLDQLKAMNK